MARFRCSKPSCNNTWTDVSKNPTFCMLHDAPRPPGIQMISVAKPQTRLNAGGGTTVGDIADRAAWLLWRRFLRKWW